MSITSLETDSVYNYGHHMSLFYFHEALSLNTVEFVIFKPSFVTQPSIKHSV